MRILLTGGSGQLGYDIKKLALEDKKHTIVAPSRDELDLSSSKSILDYLKGENFDAILHAGAYTAVDKAEEEVDLCMRINKEASILLAKEAKRMKAKYLFVSTDYVFDGKKKSAYLVTDKTNAIGVYGDSKAKGEEGILKVYPEKSFIVRTSWVFGINGNNFVKTMLRVAEKNPKVKVVMDQYSAPTYTPDLARLLLNMLETDRYGLYQAHNEGGCTKSDFTRGIYKAKGLNISVEDVTGDVFPTPASRPEYSFMDTSLLKENGFELLPSWENALKRYIKELENC